MNTFKIGDDFESKAYELICNEIDNGNFGITSGSAKVERKKGYYSPLREKDIIFDLSIEIWLPNAPQFSFLYLIECKNYGSKKVPVDDVEEFRDKINQISNHGFFVKGCMISNSSFQEGAFKLAQNTHLMILEIGTNDQLSYILYKQEKNSTSQPNIESDHEQQFEIFIRKIFNLDKIEGLKRITKKEIDSIAENILEKINPTIFKDYSKASTEEIIAYFDKVYDLKFNFERDIYDPNSKKILGSISFKENTIFIDRLVSKSPRFKFILAHELGHYILHRELIMSQLVYESFEESEYDFLSDKYMLKNDKNWVEWQANRFASAFILPESSFINRLIYFQISIGISKFGKIYLDDQPINQQDYMRSVDYLSDFFQTTHTSIRYRLQDLGIITYASSISKFKDELRSIYNHL